jgi:acetyl-CoA carboxylase carboxyltransferase component
MFITGPEVIKTVLGEDISMEELGGARVQAEVTGNVHFFAESEIECFEQIKKLCSFIPWNNLKRAEPFPKKPPRVRQYNLEKVFPTNPRQPYDVKDVIRGICDDSDFLEIQDLFAQNIVIGFARMNGYTVGFVANQPLVLAGVLDVDSSDKAARFIRYCDAFSIPLVTMVDLPGYLPGVDQEHAGVIRHGAKVLYAYSEATVPKITVITRKAYGGGYIAMCSSHLRADFVFAWPTAEIAVMGPAGAIKIVNKHELSKAENKAELEKILTDKYKNEVANPYKAEEFGLIDEVIVPSKTREILITAYEILSNKQYHKPARKHGSIPL